MAIMTTHVGSLPRPKEMVTQQLRKEAISEAQIAAYTEEIVARQLHIGLDIINNGELPRSDYTNSTIGRLSGFGGNCVAPIPKDLEELPEYSRKFSGRNGLITLNPKAPIQLPACNAELSYVDDGSLTRELETLVSTHEKQPEFRDSQLFFTAPSPGTIALFLANQYYPDYTRYVEKLGELLQREYEVIASHNVMLQIDCPDLAMGKHTAYKDLGIEEFAALSDINIGVLNASLANIDSTRCRAHICWGNYPGSHHCDIELKHILPGIGKLKPRYISLEACNHRHSHEWELLNASSFPADKVLMPGVIDTNTNIVEHPDLIARRLMDFASVLGDDRVIASTDCGFASTAGAASVASEIAWLKLAALVEGTRRANERINRT